jgi:3-hydroxyisobutyrate dehydrogenase-like beta-hydroxyacid dehydrogenase
MANIAVIGTGNMGAACARVLAESGHTVAVWNRTRSKAESLADVARIADTPEDAIGDADLVVVSQSNFDATTSTLQNDACAGALRGRTVLQLTSGSPSEARASAAWAAENGIGYLEGKVMAYPSGVGTDAATFFYSGDKTLFDRHLPTLRALANDASIHVAEPIGAASCMELAIIIPYMAAGAGFMHGAAMCQSEGVPIGVYFEQREAAVTLIRELADAWLPRVVKRDYADSEATMKVHADGVAMLVRLAREAGIDTSFPVALHEVYSRAVYRGQGDADAAVIFETFIAP